MDRVGAPAKYRANIQSLLESKRFIGEAGLETSLLFDEKLDLPFFASFEVMLRDKELARRWQNKFLDNARKHGCGYWLDTKTWRANPDYAIKLHVKDMEQVWRDTLSDALQFRAENETTEVPIVVSGVVGPRRDGYRIDPSVKLSVEDSREYHRTQVRAFAKYGADVITAYTMNHYEEAAGIILACKEEGMPVIISFTVETDGKLASGETLARVIQRIDDATASYALFYMINCAHPSHMENAFKDKELTRSRLKGLFPNSSKKSHAELDESTELDRGEPDKIGEQLFSLVRQCDMHPCLVGGCCGTGLDHVANISASFEKLQ